MAEGRSQVRIRKDDAVVVAHAAFVLHIAAGSGSEVERARRSQVLCPDI